MDEKHKAKNEPHCGYWGSCNFRNIYNECMKKDYCGSKKIPNSNPKYE